ncbi:mediator of RNA polymerase II transcription subunit 1 [Chelonus insularis]|uniref:mediator of RNA polymerase II transcription subunit 1 n=1 Tax=Chelonus insularis TaxID=460826 RepID=UPI00158B9308|nr:mediator of RNA polymerase II transcription subunit 1 [Chelonus insularis]
MDTNNSQKPLGGQSTGGGTGNDKNKEWQMELLMEKLRSKASAFKSLMETAKNLRMAMLDKRFAIDSVEKSQLQKCLDTLQHSIKVTSLQSMVERLESLSRQLGLKFMSAPSGTELFISSDMFFLEVLLEPTGVVKDVKIHHEGKNEQQSCEELVACLSRGDFVDFTAQLEGLASIYQLNADKKVKCKAFCALQSLEADLGVLAQLQTFMKESFNLVHKSPVGILERRKGGHPMKLTYFVSPYDLIDQDNRIIEQLSPETIITRKIGHSVTVCLEGSTAHKLPTSSIITVNRSPTGKNTPSYAPLTGANSSMLPACFVLKLAKKMPMCLELVHRIQKVTEMECVDVSAPQPILSLIVQHASGGQLDCRNNRGLYVTLPDQQHCYFMTENKSMEGVLVGSIPFTHPAHVPQILGCLRQQALFNTLVMSCVRSMARQEVEQTTIFEVSALSWQHVSVSLEHPFEETLATAELDLTDISALKCKLYGVSMTNTEQTSEIVSKVLQRCLSIPVTMRALIKIWEGRNSIQINGISSGGTGSGATNGGNYGVNLGSGREQNGHDGPTCIPDFTNGEPKIKHEPGLNGNNNNSISRQSTPSHQQQSFLDAGTENSIGFPSFSGQSDTSAAMLNPLQLGALLSQGKSSPVGGLGSTTPTSDRSKKTRKRKTADGLWRSPKNKSDDSGEILLESSSSDSTPLGTPTSRDNANGTRTPTPTSAAVSLVSGLDLSNLDASDIVGGDTRSSTDYDVENESEVMEVHDLPDDYGEIMKRDRKSRKSREEKKSPSVFEDNKSNLVPPSVSITPISSGGIGQTTNYNSVLTGMGLDRRPGIEIIPISSSPQTNLPSSITITPITGATIKPVTSDERRDRKNKTSDDKSRLEKKRKRKREDSPMGPPEKLPPKQPQDPLSKPVSVSIKPTEPQPNIGSRPSSPATTLRKLNPSPTHTSPLALLGKSSPTLRQPASASNTGTSASTSSTSSKSMPSPKHSPVYNSPKHSSSGIPASVSPKHGTCSPKHGSTTSTGKPSMSALKSAANNSPSACGKSSSESSSSSSKPKSSSSKETSRDKERKIPSSSTSSSSTSGLSFNSGSSGHQSPKTKSSSSKLKSIELLPNAGEPPPTSMSGSGGNTPPSGSSDLSKSSTAQQQQARNRKGSLSAVIDKLKNAQHVSDDPGNGGSSSKSGGNSSSGESGQKERPTTSSNKTSEGKSMGKNSPALDTKNPAEYMVKHSLDGMKITINKTRAKDSKAGSNVKLSSSTGNVSGSMSSSVSNSGNGSPKTHTGLKPGVNSGPASKKPQSQSVKTSSQQGGLTSAVGNKLSMAGQKVSNLKSTSSSSSGGLLAKSTTKASSGSPKMSSSGATDLSRNRDKPRLQKSVDKSGNLFSSKSTDSRKASPSPLREESESERAFKILAAHTSMSIFDSKFQIPKLSARVNAEAAEKKFGEKLSSSTSIDHSSSKLLDTLSSNKIDQAKIQSLPNTSLSSNVKSTDIMDQSSMSNRRDINQTKSDNLSTNPMPMLNLSSTLDPSMILQPPSSSSSIVPAASHDSDVPTNLSMQPDAEIRDVCKDLSITPRSSASQYLKNMSSMSSSSSSGSNEDNANILSHINVDTTSSTDTLGSSKTASTYSSSTSSNTTGSTLGDNVSSESLNLSTKPADAALNKYNKSLEERKSLDRSSIQSSTPPMTASSSSSSIDVSSVNKSTTPIPGESLEVNEMLLDFSTPKDIGKMSLSTVPERTMNLQSVPVRRNTPPPPPPPPAFPPSPSLSLHIVKSPAPSPRVIPPSPHSTTSPCITDDELMDEALVGLGK